MPNGLESPDPCGLYLFGVRHSKGRRFWLTRAFNWLKNNKEAWGPIATLVVGLIGGLFATMLTMRYTNRQTALQTRQALGSAYLALGDKEKKVYAIRSLAVYADEFEENTLDILVDMLDDEQLIVRKAAVETLQRISRKKFSTVRSRLRRELQFPNHPAAAGVALATID